MVWSTKTFTRFFRPWHGSIVLSCTEEAVGLCLCSLRTCNGWCPSFIIENLTANVCESLKCETEVTGLIWVGITGPLIKGAVWVVATSGGRTPLLGVMAAGVMEEEEGGGGSMVVITLIAATESTLRDVPTTRDMVAGEINKKPLLPIQ